MRAPNICPKCETEVKECLFDVATMNPKDSMGNQSNGNYSVSKGLVYFGLPIHYDKYSLESVCCIVHGSMLAVAKLGESRMLYRCEVCNNGGILQKCKAVTNVRNPLKFWGGKQN